MLVDFNLVFNRTVFLVNKSSKYILFQTFLTTNSLRIIRAKRTYTFFNRNFTSRIDRMDLLCLANEWII